MSTIIDLSREILKDAEAINAYFRDNDLQQPSFDINGPGRIKVDDEGVNSAHQRLILSARELHHLALGPAESLRALANVCSYGLPKRCSLRLTF